MKVKNVREKFTNIKTYQVKHQNELPDNIDNEQYHIEIPDTVTDISSAAFMNCTGLISVIIPSSTQVISTSAFRNCTGLTSIIIPNSVYQIEEEAFADCRGITSVILPTASNLTIGEYAFVNCSSLTSIIIPESLVKMDKGVFYGCSSLIWVTLPYNFDNLIFPYKKNWIFNFSTLKTLKIFNIGWKKGSHCIPSSSNESSNYGVYKVIKHREAVDWCNNNSNCYGITERIDKYGKKEYLYKTNKDGKGKITAYDKPTGSTWYNYNCYIKNFYNGYSFG